MFGVGSSSVRRSSLRVRQDLQFRQTVLAKILIGASLIGLAGCEGILGGIQDPGSGSGCTLIVNILPVCGGAANNAPPVQPSDLLKEDAGSNLAWLEALLKQVTDRV